MAVPPTQFKLVGGGVEMKREKKRGGLSKMACITGTDDDLLQQLEREYEGGTGPLSKLKLHRHFLSLLF